MNNPAHYTCTKSYSNLPTVHRAWNAESHCRFLHGYSRTFIFTFACKELSKEGFVVDFGSLKPLKQWLEEQFDHTVVVSASDPELSTMYDLDKRGIIDLRVFKYGCHMEGSARHAFEYADSLVREQSKGRAWVVEVEAKENDKNAVVYKP